MFKKKEKKKKPRSFLTYICYKNLGKAKNLPDLHVIGKDCVAVD